MRITAVNSPLTIDYQCSVGEDVHEGRIEVERIGTVGFNQHRSAIKTRRPLSEVSIDDRDGEF